MADAALQGNIDRVVRRSDFEDRPSGYYEDSDGQEHKYPRAGQGPARLADESDLERDALGFTHPNLHRRVDPQDPDTADSEYNQEKYPRGYQLMIQNVHSYRTTTINAHDEESIDSEIP